MVEKSKEYPTYLDGFIQVALPLGEYLEQCEAMDNWFDHDCTSEVIGAVVVESQTEPPYQFLHKLGVLIKMTLESHLESWNLAQISSDEVPWAVFLFREESDAVLFKLTWK